MREIERYAELHTSPVSELLVELEKETIEKTGMPNMLTGRTEGRLLQILVSISRAKKVLEIGTFTGYSALMMAEGLREGGELVTLEVEKEYAGIAKKYFKRSPHGKKVRIKLGPAMDSMRRMPRKSFDFVFIDADKGSYSLYYEESLRLLKKGGIIVADNTLWYGRVLSPQDSDAKAISEFNDMVGNDKRVEKVMLTIRDGVYLIRKK